MESWNQGTLLHQLWADFGRDQYSRCTRKIGNMSGRFLPSTPTNWSILNSLFLFHRGTDFPQVTSGNRPQTTDSARAIWRRDCFCQVNHLRGGQGPDALPTICPVAGPDPIFLEVGLDFSEELNTVADAWTWSRNPNTQAQFIRKCFRNGLWVEWWPTADGWELRIRRPENRPTTSATRS
jgi:hypothetical protein